MEVGPISLILNCYSTDFVSFQKLITNVYIYIILYIYTVLSQYLMINEITKINTC